MKDGAPLLYATSIGRITIDHMCRQRENMTIRIGQSEVYVSGRGSDDVVRNLPGVHQKLTEGIKSLPGWRKGVRRRRLRLVGRLSE
ncbi:hypothetical protein B296_00016292 [Ensete ventricosum]|uniref:Uncharacterized protein n=1 Tax=Ensete ventricosum TaxID=4639 RepID=A0A426ZUB7_ENSVE|nr:hypothetical protein B296_00016292 [Ensete ventricosum]